MHPDLATLDEKIVAMDVWHVALPVNSRRDHGIGTVADAIEIVRPWGVDASSGLERAPGRKDAEKVSAYVEKMVKSLKSFLRA